MTSEMHESRRFGLQMDRQTPKIAPKCSQTHPGTTLGRFWAVWKHFKIFDFFGPKSDPKFGFGVPKSELGPPGSRAEGRPWRSISKRNRLDLAI